MDQFLFLIKLNAERRFMGPQILLDKSSLESLTKSEAMFLGKYYSLVVPPVLMGEILADLNKSQKARKKRKTQLKNQAVELANKLRSISSRSFNIPQRYLNLQNLLGNTISLTHRPVIGGNPVITDRGEKGFFADDTQENALFQWSQGRFTEGDKFSAYEWRNSISNIDLESTKRELRKWIGKINFRTMQELEKKMDELLQDVSRQEDYIRLQLKWSHADRDLITQVITRWHRLGKPLLRNFAPYSYYCTKLLLAFCFGLAGGLLGTRATNRIDLEYLFYVPFCLAFSSGDKFHKQMITLCIDSEQDFIWKDILKTDLRKIADVWYKPNHKKYILAYPPEIPDSITLQLWQKHMRSKEEIGRDHEGLSPEEESELAKRLTEFTKAEPLQ